MKLTAYSCICWLFHRIYYDARNHKHKIELHVIKNTEGVICGFLSGAVMQHRRWASSSYFKESRCLNHQGRTLRLLDPEEGTVIIQNVGETPTQWQSVILYFRRLEKKILWIPLQWHKTSVVIIYITGLCWPNTFHVWLQLPEKVSGKHHSTHSVLQNTEYKPYLKYSVPIFVE